MRTARVAILTLAINAVAFAQEQPAPRPPLTFDPPPATWTPHPAESKPFLLDYDLPAAEGDEGGGGLRVNVLEYPMGFDDYCAKILGKWRRADGEQLTADDQSVEQLDVNGLTIRVVDQRGTHTPREGPARPGWRLVAAHVQADTRYWTVWLMGPATGVERHRAEYIAWLRTAKVGAALAAPADDVLRNVRYVHGAPSHGTPSPLAVLGHRIGADALKRFSATREDGWHLLVILRAPEGHALMAALDGLLAATGASPGKGNLRLEPRADAPSEVEVTHRPTGRVLTYRLSDTAVARLAAVPTADYTRGVEELGRLQDAVLFTVAESRRAER